MGELTFIIPVRHQNSIADWDSARDRIDATLRSIAAQDNPHWSCVIVANRGAVLPPTDDPRIKTCRVDLPLPALPDRAVDRHGYEEAVRADKGRRILYGLLQARPQGHVMVVDYDDLVSRRLAQTVADNADAPGWYLETGYLYDGQGFIYRAHDFDTICGTSFIVRADLLRLPESVAAADENWLRRILGSHLFLRHHLASEGIMLAQLAYPGAMYRVGHAEATNRSQPMMATAFGPLSALARRPHRLFHILARFRRLSQPVRQEFFGDATHNVSPGHLLTK